MPYPARSLPRRNLTLVAALAFASRQWVSVFRDRLEFCSSIIARELDPSPLHFLLARCVQAGAATQFPRSSGEI